MPTATSFSWVLSWNEIVGGFNAFAAMLGTPVALEVALILAFAVAGMDIGNGIYGLKSQWMGDDIISIWNEGDDELIDVFRYRESD